ncbi:MAG TPA: glycosyltransferase family 4 protein [Tepidisphaeraceae bacterium]|nr:glycosyltransferase family 4 protein [Tepidisphaeraceae bacterium]
MTRGLACLGNAADIRTWSNIPYFFFKAAAKIGFLTHALDLMPENYSKRRLRWNLLAPLRLQKPGGYQYSRSNIERMWQRVPEEVRAGEIISHFQLFPPLNRARQSGLIHSFYCDATLKQLYPPGQQYGIDPRFMAEMFRRERELYEHAKFFIGMATETARSAIEDYGVNPAKVFVVRPGANIDEDVVREYLATRGESWRSRGEPFTDKHPARLGFIGMDWKRKGLERLVEAAKILHARGRSVRVAIIGDCPQCLRDEPVAEWLGVISKATQMREFVSAIDTFALGCLPSYSEPLGISTLECLRLGVPVMGTRVGGIPDCVPQTGGFLVPGNVNADDLADAIDARVFDPAIYRAMVQGAIEEMNRVSWDATARRFIELWRPAPTNGFSELPNSNN